jgi:hypothetical protein
LSWHHGDGHGHVLAGAEEREREPEGLRFGGASIKGVRSLCEREEGLGVLKKAGVAGSLLFRDVASAC